MKIAWLGLVALVALLASLAAAQEEAPAQPPQAAPPAPAAQLPPAQAAGQSPESAAPVSAPESVVASTSSPLPAAYSAAPPATGDGSAGGANAGSVVVAGSVVESAGGIAAPAGQATAIAEVIVAEVSSRFAASEAGTAAVVDASEVTRIAAEIAAGDDAVVKAITQRIEASAPASAERIYAVAQVIAFTREVASGEQTADAQENVFEAAVEKPVVVMKLLERGASAQRIVAALSAGLSVEDVDEEVIATPSPSATPEPECGGSTPGEYPPGLVCQPFNDFDEPGAPKNYRYEPAIPTPGPGCVGVVCATGEICDPTTGSCEAIPCYPGCPYGYTCMNNQCMGNCIVTGCPPGNYCFTGGGAAYCTPVTCEQTGCPFGRACVNRRCVTVRPPPPAPVVDEDAYDKCVEDCLNEGNSAYYCTNKCLNEHRKN